MSRLTKSNVISLKDRADSKQERDSVADRRMSRTLSALRGALAILRVHDDVQELKEVIEQMRDLEHKFTLNLPPEYR